MKNSVIKVFKGTDNNGREVMKAAVWWGEEKAEVEGVISYPGNTEPVLNVTTKTLFDKLILQLDKSSLDAAYQSYNENDLGLQ